MSKKAKFCRALIALLGFGALTASKCDGPVDMYGPAPMYGVPTDSSVLVMYGPRVYSKMSVPDSEAQNVDVTPTEDNK